MANILKRNESPFWVACYTDRNGRQMKKSTKTTDRGQAMQIALELEGVECKARAGSLIITQVRKVLSDVSEKVTGNSLITPTVEDYLNDWLKGIEARNSKATLERYGNTVRLFLANSNGKAKRPVSSILPKDVEDFLTWRLNAGAAPKTAIVDLKTLNTAFRRAEAFGTILKNPVAAIRPPKDESSERDVFTHEEVQKLIAAAPSLDWETLILLGYFVGARLRDCVQMKWDNVFPEQGVIIYNQQKTGKKVIVPMHHEIIRHIEYKIQFGTTGYLCPKLAEKGPGGKHGLSEGFKRIVVKAGLDLMVIQGKGSRKFCRRTFHSLRHSFNSILANAGVSDEVRMKLTGHKSKEMNIRTHQRLMESTRLNFTVFLEGKPIDEDAVALFDQRRIESGERIPLGRHTVTIRHPKADAFSTNLVVWYGAQNLGAVSLKRSMGALAITANPRAGLITIQGPEFSTKLTNSAGMTLNVPTDHYTVEASYAHWQQAEETTVEPAHTGACAFAPRLGAMQLACGQPEASFQLFKADGQLLEAGNLPALLVEVPEGNYQLISWHHKHKKDQTVAVTAATTNSMEIEFVYGAARLETTPSGATVLTDGHQWGVTPMLFSELTTGRWHFELQLSGYSPVDAVVDVAARETNTFVTNLVSINYVPAMNAARQYLSAGDYDKAFRAAAEALEVKPNDPEAMTLQKEATGRRHIRQAEALGKRGDYIGADKELEAALESLPDNDEVKQLLADFKTRERGQLEQLQQERRERGQKLFDTILSRFKDAELFDSHEIKTTRPLNEVQTAILSALKIRPEFRVLKSRSSVAETFEISAVQELTGALATSAGRRQCVIVMAQTRDDETQILFKVLEFKAHHSVGTKGLLNLTDNVTFIPVHPSRIPDFTDKLKSQLEEGTKMVTDRIQQAIGGGSEKK